MSRLKEARKAIGFTQTELGEAVGIIRETYGNMEKDDSPSTKVVKYLAEEHDISPLYLLLGDEYPMSLTETKAQAQLLAKLKALLNE